MGKLWALFTYGIAAAVVAVLSYATAARLPGLREPFWAPLAALVVLYPDRKATLEAGLQYSIGTAAGSAIGWVCSAVWHGSLAVYGAGIMIAVGIAHLVRCQAAARLCAVAVTVITIVPHAEPPHLVALIRFVEVSYGVACALAYSLAAEAVATRFLHRLQLQRRSRTEKAPSGALRDKNRVRCSDDVQVERHAEKLPE